jgi:outer membrane protein OmpA-like peptidoglycan-associated protein
VPSYDIRQDKSYRRGLVLGLTMAEIMILLIFVLLMALASALANREKRIEALNDGVGSKLVEAIQKAYPQVQTPDDYYKELVRAIEARKTIDSVGGKRARDQVLADAQLGQLVRQQAPQITTDSLPEFMKEAIAQAKTGKKGKWPPFFSLSEAGGYYFESGKATLRPDFIVKLKTTIIPLLRQYIDDYGIDVVEVTGHTDEVPMLGTSNLDQLLIEASANRVPTEALQSTDNAGLAIARAVSVVRILRADPRLHGITILPLSGAQLIVPVDRSADGTAAGSDQLRRRIEIRLRRSTAAVKSSERNE